MTSSPHPLPAAVLPWCSSSKVRGEPGLTIGCPQTRSPELPWLGCGPHGCRPPAPLPLPNHSLVTCNQSGPTWVPQGYTARRGLLCGHMATTARPAPSDHCPSLAPGGEGTGGCPAGRFTEAYAEGRTGHTTTRTKNTQSKASFQGHRFEHTAKGGARVEPPVLWGQGEANRTAPDTDSQGRALLCHPEVTVALGPPLGSRWPSGPNTTERTCSSVLGGHGASMGMGRQA